MGSARGFIDDAKIEVPCPTCGKAIKTTIGAGRRSRTLRCPSGHSVPVDGSDLDRGTRKVE